MRHIAAIERAAFIEKLSRQEGRRTKASLAACGAWLAFMGLFGSAIHRTGTQVAARVMNTHEVLFVVVLAVIVFITLGLPTILATELYRWVLGRSLVRAMDALGGRRVCVGCLYDIHDLQGADGARCPECGREIAAISQDGGA